VLVLVPVPLAARYVYDHLHDYQRARIDTFINPESDPLGAGYNIIQSKIALGSGGMWGKGFLQGTQGHLDFLPEKQTDFIFTMIGEEFGLVGTLCVTALYGGLAGLAIGLVSGFVRWADGILMRFMDGLMSIPPILFAVALMALTRGSVGNVIMAITIAEIPRVSRLVRGVVLSLREQPYVDAATASGTRTPMIILRHILPNTLAPMLVQATYLCASAMIVESILSFIGAGTPPTIPSWGNIMAEGRALWQVKPFIVFFPAAFLSVTVLAVNLLGDGLRDALDPRMAKSL